jgi:BMFP domain-containing protein YqiC
MELEQFVLLLSQALTNEQGIGMNSEAAMVKNFANQFNINMNLDNIEKQRQSGSNLQEKIHQALCRMDLLLKENFNLKREIVFDKKKFVDLQQAYKDLKSYVQRESVSSQSEIGASP